MNKVIVSTILTSVLMISSAHAAPGSVNNASAASKHSALAAAHSTVASAQVTSVAVAIPLQVAGSLGQASTAAGNKLMESATSNEPLPITEQTISADVPPMQAMKTKASKD